MTERQFRQTMQNHRGYAVGSVLDARLLAAELERVARASQRRADARAAWHRLAEPQWLREADVLDMTGDTIRIGVVSSTLRHHLVRNSQRLARALRAAVPGARRVLWVPVATLEEYSD